MVAMALSTKLETPSVTYEQPLGLYIDGKFVAGKEGKTFETINPATEKPIASVHEAGPEGEHECSTSRSLVLWLTRCRCRYRGHSSTKGSERDLGRDDSFRSRPHVDEARRSVR